MLSSYIERPQYCRFEGQDPNEKILLLLRAHPITNIPWVIFAVFVFAIPFVTPQAALFASLPLALVPQSFILILLVINYLLVLVIVFEGFLGWYFNVTLVTNEKVVDVDFAYLLYKAVDLAPLSKIEETDSVTAGILGTIFNFGNVRVQTAGASVAIEMRKIPRPAVVADMILDLIGKPHDHIIPASPAGGPEHK